MSHTFWLNNPSVLLDKKYITELWPSEAESTETKLNAYTRLIIMLKGHELTEEIIEKILEVGRRLKQKKEKASPKAP